MIFDKLLRKTSVLRISYLVLVFQSSPRNWLLLADVLGRLRMTSRSFRRLFPQLNIQSIPEDEFYRQASLSQLLTGPDEQELASFRPDIRDPLELVEATPELAGMLGSSLEFVDTRWDSFEVSPPATPSPAAESLASRPAKRLVLRPSQLFTSLLQKHHQGATEVGAVLDGPLQNKGANYGQLRGFKNLEYSMASAKVGGKPDAYMWEQLGCINASPLIPAKPDVKLNASMGEPHRQPSKAFTAYTNGPKSDSGLWQRQLGITSVAGNPACCDAKNVANVSEQQNKTGDLPKMASSDSKVVSVIVLDDTQQGGKGTSDATDKSSQAVGGGLKELQPLWNKWDANADAAMQDKDCPDLATSGGAGEANTNKQNQEVKPGDALGSADDSPAESTATTDVSRWEWQEAKSVGGATGAKREASFCDFGPGGKVIKMDAAWPKNLGNVRVHIRDLGMNLDPALLRRDANKDSGRNAGKGPRVKARS